MQNSPEELGRILDVLQDPQALDTVLVCSIMAGEGLGDWGPFDKRNLSKIVEAQGNGKHSSLKSRDTDTIRHLIDSTDNGVVDFFGAVSRRKKWHQVKVAYAERVFKRDESDPEENRAWAICTEASYTLEKLYESGVSVES